MMGWMLAAMKFEDLRAVRRNLEVRDRCRHAISGLASDPPQRRSWWAPRYSDTNYNIEFLNRLIRESVILVSSEIGIYC